MNINAYVIIWHAVFNCCLCTREDIHLTLEDVKSSCTIIIGCGFLEQNLCNAMLPSITWPFSVHHLLLPTTIIYIVFALSLKRVYPYRRHHHYHHHQHHHQLYHRKKKDKKGQRPEPASSKTKPMALDGAGSTNKKV